MSIKKIVTTGALIALIGTQSYGAAAPEQIDKDTLNELLRQAAQHGDTLAIETLIEAKADVKATDQNGKSPLKLAAENNHEAAIDLLLKQGAGPASLQIQAARLIANELTRPTIKNGHAIITQQQIETELPQAAQECIVLQKYRGYLLNDPIAPLHALIWTINDHFYCGARVILEKYKGQFDINSYLPTPDLRRATSENNRTPLIAAALESDLNIMTLLLAHGADTTVKNIFLDTTLTTAAKNGNAHIITLLLFHGAQACLNDKDSFGMTPLMHAAKTGSLAAVQVLLEAGANPTIINTSFDAPFRAATALNYATRALDTAFDHFKCTTPNQRANLTKIITLLESASRADAGIRQVETKMEIVKIEEVD